VPGADSFHLCRAFETRQGLPKLPAHSREAVEQELTLDFLDMQIESAEQRLEEIMQVSVEALRRPHLKHGPDVGNRQIISHD